MRVACVTKQALLQERSWAKAWPGLGGEWAAEAVRRHYEIDAAKVCVVSPRRRRALQGSRALVVSRMNWSAAARAVAGILDEVVRGRGAR